MGLIPASIQTKISKINGSSSPASPSQHHSFVAHRRQKHNKEFVDFLANGWPGSTLNWTKEDLGDFSACFRPIRVKCGEEIPVSGKANDRFFFLVAEGAVEISTLLPTKSKKTDNVREFLAKKQKGDMVYLPSVRKLIAESNSREIYERENRDSKKTPHVHKNALDLIDTVGIKSLENSTLLQLDWPLFEAKFGPLAERPAGSKLDIAMLRSLMETNLTDYLSHIPILEDISFGKLEMLSRLCHYCVKKKGEVVFEEGDKGDEVFIILLGTVRVDALASKQIAEIVHTEDDIACDIARAEEGLEGLSGRELIINQTLSIANTSEDDDQSSRSGRKGSVCTGCDYTKGIRLSKGQEELNLRRRTLVAAGDKFRREAAERNSDTENKDANGGLESGCVEQQIVELGKLGPGEYTGEMSCFVDLPRSATVTTESNVLLAALSNSSFRTLVKSISPQLESTLEEKVKRCMISNIFELKSPFQQPISIDQTQQMSDDSAIVRYDKDAIVFREGWPADKFYFVYSGSLSVEKNAPEGKRRTVGKLGPGDYFGERGVSITGSTRLATVRASSDVAVLLEISADKFVSCFASNPDLLAEFVFRIKGSSVDLMSMLECKVARDAFHIYCSGDDNKCNPSDLALYEEVTDYEATFFPEGMSLNTWRKAKHIVDRYMIPENQDQFVDLPGDATKEARDRVAFDTDGEVDRYLFQVPKQLLHERLSATLDQYKTTEAFHRLLKKMRAYDDLDKSLAA
mmetsp:Transcript_15664/g.45234  ORF Transcript_15664/g.45234 Transcript_15664/m.45234 type:complete len:745 (+) Transcript_15664:579-2813(+)